MARDNLRRLRFRYFEAFHELEEWQTAVECLIGAAEDRDYLKHVCVSGCCGR
jgi:hypothetical protein